MKERVKGGGKKVELALIALKKNAGAGLGFNVVGGRDQEHIPGDPGIFVSRVRRDGAAYNDGRLKEGDRIVSVNGEWLGDVDHDAAVGVLRACSGTVRLQVEPEAEKTALNVKGMGMAGQASAASLARGNMQQLGLAGGKVLGVQNKPNVYNTVSNGHYPQDPRIVAYQNAGGYAGRKH